MKNTDDQAVPMAFAGDPGIRGFERGDALSYVCKMFRMNSTTGTWRWIEALVDVPWLKPVDFQLHRLAELVREEETLLRDLSDWAQQEYAAARKGELTAVLGMRDLPCVEAE